MKTINNPAPKKWTKLTQRPVIKQQKLMKTVEKIFYKIDKKGDKQTV